MEKLTADPILLIKRIDNMWYFTWILGLTAALALGVINVMWYDAREDSENQNSQK